MHPPRPHTHRPASTPLRVATTRYLVLLTCPCLCLGGVRWCVVAVGLCLVAQPASAMSLEASSSSPGPDSASPRGDMVAHEGLRASSSSIAHEPLEQRIHFYKQWLLASDLELASDGSFAARIQGTDVWMRVWPLVHYACSVGVQLIVLGDEPRCGTLVRLLKDSRGVVQVDNSEEMVRPIPAAEGVIEPRPRPRLLLSPSLRDMTIPPLSRL